MTGGVLWGVFDKQDVVVGNPGHTIYETGRLILPCSLNFRAAVPIPQGPRNPWTLVSLSDEQLLRSARPHSPPH